MDTTSKKNMSKEHALEIFSAILLSLATIASAWSAYQATRWSGVQAIDFSLAAANRAEATRKTNIGAQLFAIDIGLFVQYAAARSTHNDTLATFLLNRFRPELKEATEAWLETKPLKNPDAPRSPFRMPQYTIKERNEAEQLLKKAEQTFEDAKNANQTGDNYVLLTVLFASVLFFAGVGTKFEVYRIKLIMLVFGLFIFISAAIVVLSFPVH